MLDSLFCQDLIKNNLGVSIGIVPAITDMYVDMPMNTWPNKHTGILFQGFYTRQVSESFRIGAYLGYEKINFSDIAETTVNSLNNYKIGLDWLGQFPKKPLNMQLGGFFGYGFLSAKTWDKLNGFEYGMIAGPAYEFEKIGIALHVHYGRAWYESTGLPIGVMLYDPKILLKVYYRLTDF